MNCIMKYINELSLLSSMILLGITFIGYILGITIICGSLFVLCRTITLTVVKIDTYLVTKIYKKYVNITLLSIEDEGLIY